MAFLVADTRESKLLPYLKSMENLKILQINTGDFLICSGESEDAMQIHACIERKTYIDFAASFKDGRYKNVDKMLALRETTGCILYFLIEGPAFPLETQYFAGIPYKNIIAAIDKLMIEHGIFVIQSENERNSAERLGILLRSFESFDVTLKQTILLGRKELTQRPKQSSEAAAILMLSTVKGISEATAKSILKKNTIQEILDGADVSVFVTQSGRKLNAAVYECLKTLSDSSIIEMISQIDGITKKKAEEMFLEHGRQLLMQDNKLAGPARSKKIFEAFNFKYSDCPPTD